MRTIVLECDEDDWNAIQNELALRQARRDEHGAMLPDGESNLPAAILAECCRDLIDYRALFDAPNPNAD